MKNQILLLAALLVSATVNAGPVLLAWDRPISNTDGTEIPADPPIIYRVRTGPAPGFYTATNDTAETTVTIDTTPNELRYTTVTAINSLGMESVPTPELVWASPLLYNAPTNLHVVAGTTIINNGGVVHVNVAGSAQ